MIIRLTQKLATKLGETPANALPRDPDLFSDWIQSPESVLGLSRWTRSKPWPSAVTWPPGEKSGNPKTPRPYPRPTSWPDC